MIKFNLKHSHIHRRFRGRGSPITNMIWRVRLQSLEDIICIESHRERNKHYGGGGVEQTTREPRGRPV